MGSHCECRRELSVNNLCVGHIWVEDDDVNSSSCICTLYLGKKMYHYNFALREPKKFARTSISKEGHHIDFDARSISECVMPSIFVSVLLKNCNSCYLGY